MRTHAQNLPRGIKNSRRGALGPPILFLSGSSSFSSEASTLDIPGKNARAKKGSCRGLLPALVFQRPRSREGGVSK